MRVTGSIQKNYGFSTNKKIYVLPLSCSFGSSAAIFFWYFFTAEALFLSSIKLGHRTRNGTISTSSKVIEFLIAALIFSAGYYSAHIFFYNSKNLNCIGALSFFKICSHIFLIFEVKLE